MSIPNTAFTDTFETWRTNTNEVTVAVNQLVLGQILSINVVSMLATTYTNVAAAFAVANATFSNVAVNPNTAKPFSFANSTGNFLAGTSTVSNTINYVAQAGIMLLIDNGNNAISITGIGSVTANNASVNAGASFTFANGVSLVAANASSNAAGAFNQANLSYTFANTVSLVAANAVTNAAAAFNQANAASLVAANASTNAAAAFGVANLALPAVGGTISGNLIIDGNLNVISTSGFYGVLENVALGGASTGNINVSFLTSGINFNTSNATGNVTLNFRGNATATLNNSMTVGQVWTSAFEMFNGITPYYVILVQIDNTNVTVKWPNGNAPTSGLANSLESYAFSIFKTGQATYTVTGSLTHYQ